MVVMVICLALLKLVSGPCCPDVKMAPVGEGVKMAPVGEEVKNVPVKGMVTMVDLGAASCVPCKMMAPILDKLEKRYQAKAAVVFIDLRYNQEAAQQFRVQAIPTQIFFDKDGREINRHIGYMNEEAIVAQLKSMGVQ
ncbi:MAG: thioredoxin family protein [Deltaproteobacteria bacterium]|nr:thioredoxin family protein [Deltaproteobacteria bacterium]